MCANLLRADRAYNERVLSLPTPAGVKVNHLPTVELLENTHTFPCPYTFKVIGRPEDGFVARAVAAIRDQLEGEVDPPFRVRETKGGRHISVSLEPLVQNGWEVVAIYQRLSGLRGLEYVF